MLFWGVTLTFHKFVIYHSSQIRSKTFNRIKENIFIDKVEHIGTVLSELDIYEPYSITGVIMGIENKLHTRTFSHGITNITVKHQRYFIRVLGFCESLILVYNYIMRGNIPSIVFVFRVGKGDDNTIIQVKQAL